MMLDLTFTEIVGSIGVFLLLVAFFMNLVGALGAGSLSYVSLNLIGASLACYASWLLDFFPFVVLEGTWAMVAALGLGRIIIRRARAQPAAGSHGGAHDGTA
jgi:hypothetical protein